jgi:outer membrane lipoprotein-sorting protein
MKAQIMRSLVFAALLLSACATVGTKVDADQAAQFKPGIATYSEIVGKFGAPQQQVTMSTGEKTVIYSYAHSAVRATTFIPVVGAFAGGSDTTGNSVVFRFAPDGKLIDTTSSSSQMGVGTGFVPG